MIRKGLILLTLMFVLLSGSCDIWKPPFQRNPNLELLLKNDWDSFFNPVWSPDGRYIYYLRAHRDRISTPATALGIGGDLWRINLETRETEFLLSGPFCSLAISHDGSLLALSYETGDRFPYEMEWEGGPLILADTSGNILDTLPTSLPFILDVEFSSSDAKLYYYAYDTVHTGIPFGFYRINLDGSGEELVRLFQNYSVVQKTGFTLSHSDEIFVDTSISPSAYIHPQFHPEIENILLFVTGNPFTPSELKIKDLHSNKEFVLDADPYYSIEEPSGILYGYWAPSGDDIVISVGKTYGEEFHVGVLELWILHNVWEGWEKGGPR